VGDDDHQFREIAVGRDDVAVSDLKCPDYPFASIVRTAKITTIEAKESDRVAFCRAVIVRQSARTFQTVPLVRWKPAGRHAQPRKHFMQRSAR